MERAICWGTLGLTALLVLLFLVDLFVGTWPLFRASPTLDVFAILAGGVIIYVCIDTLRELR
jgi:hypothetical protein